MNVLCVDFETYFDDDYSLSKLTTEAYCRDPRFAAHGLGVRDDNGTTVWIAEPVRGELDGLCDWESTAVLCHHAAFDGLILSHHYGIIPGRWLDTYSMAQFLFGAEQSKSLGALAHRFGLAGKSIDYGSFKGKHYGELTREEQRGLADGCLRDVEITYAIFNKMMTGDY